MSLKRHFRRGIHGRIWIRTVLACVALLAVLAARNVAADFSQAPCVHAVIGASPHHDQKPRFDDSNSEWCAPANGFQLLPPTAESIHVPLTPHLSSTVQTKGFHYNRPPPMS